MAGMPGEKVRMGVLIIIFNPALILLSGPIASPGDNRIHDKKSRMYKNNL
jgi:hypothetical protein